MSTVIESEADSKAYWRRRELEHRRACNFKVCPACCELGIGPGGAHYVYHWTSCVDCGESFLLTGHPEDRLYPVAKERFDEFMDGPERFLQTLVKELSAMACTHPDILGRTKCPDCGITATEARAQ